MSDRKFVKKIYYLETIQEQTDPDLYSKEQITVTDLELALRKQFEYFNIAVDINFKESSKLTIVEAANRLKEIDQDLSTLNIKEKTITTLE